MNQRTSMDIIASFTKNLAGPGYTSVNGGSVTSCPPYSIATVALDVIAAGISLALPAGYDERVLERVKTATSWVDALVHVTKRQASELAAIASQLTELADAGTITMLPHRRESIQHLLDVVSQNRG